MDKAWQRNFLYFISFMVTLAGAYTLFWPQNGGRTLATIPMGLEEKIDEVAADVKAMKIEADVRRGARDKEIASIKEEVNKNIDTKFMILMDGINKLDNRLYEMKRSRKSARAAADQAEEEDGT